MNPYKLFKDVIVIEHETSDQCKELTNDPKDEIKEALIVNKPFAIVGSQCGAALLRGANVFAPGVLGYPYGVTPGATKLNIYVDTRNKTLQGTVTGTINNSSYVTNFDKDSFPSHFTLLGQGICMMTRKELFQPQAQESHQLPNHENDKDMNGMKRDRRLKTKVNGVAVKMIDCIFECPSINDDHLNSLCMLQNLPSIVTGHALMSGNATCSEYETILDMCAAPGGKTTHIASILSRRGKGKVIAIDKSQNKIDSINRNTKRFGLEDYVNAIIRDSTKLLTDRTTNDEQLFSENMFDRILLDAPCSALGQRPQFNISMKAKELQSFPKIQKKLFSVAYDLLKPGGVLVYSTCTFTIEENEKTVKWAIDKYSDDLIVENLFSEDSPYWDSPTQNCTLEELSKLGNPGVIPEGCEKYKDMLLKSRRFGLPISKKLNAENDTIGFYIAKFRKPKK